MSDKEWIPSLRVRNAQRVLFDLGYLCRSVPVVTPKDPDAWAHSIETINTGQIRCASIHSDIFESTAIALTLARIEQEGQSPNA